MTKKFQNTISKYGYPLGAIAVILIIWQLLFMSGLIPAYKLPAPIQVIKAFINDFPLLMRHMGTTLYEAITGLLLSLVLSFLLSALMDRFGILYKTAYPLVIITQTVPVIAIAPLLIAWLGYGVTPKIVLIMLVCFFPVTIGLLDAFRSCDKDTLNLMRAMGASKLQIFYHVKLPSALGNFFAGLKIAASYSIVGAVISEWVGGNSGLGVYMIRVKKSFSYDKMYAVIFLITALSLILITFVNILGNKIMPWKKFEGE